MTKQYDQTNSKITEETFKPKAGKLKHNYTSELELKSLLIRIKNRKIKENDILSKNNDQKNTKINKYIDLYTKLNLKKYSDPKIQSKKIKIKNKLKEKIISISEDTVIDNYSYEKFGLIIMLMIKNILTKPQFSGYTYKDEFYSDAIFKIIKYLHNFDHKLISDRTGLPVNAFAYMSQYIHNSILFIIDLKKKESEKLKKQVILEHLNHDLQLKSQYIWNQAHFNDDEEIQNLINNSKITKIIKLEKIDNTLKDELIKLSDIINASNRVEITYPKNYTITFDEYNELRNLLKSKVNLIKSKI